MRRIISSGGSRDRGATRALARAGPAGRVVAFNRDRPRAIDRHIDDFGRHLPEGRSPERDPCGEALLEALAGDDSVRREEAPCEPPGRREMGGRLATRALTRSVPHRWTDGSSGLALVAACLRGGGP